MPREVARALLERRVQLPQKPEAELHVAQWSSSMQSGSALASLCCSFLGGGLDSLTPVEAPVALCHGRT